MSLDVIRASIGQEEEIRTRLENELRDHWEAGGAGGPSAAWRLEMGQMLQDSGRVDTALALLRESLQGQDGDQWPAGH